MDSFVITPLPAELTIGEAAVRLTVDEPNSYPCRRCLTDAEVGEQALLISYDPFLADSVYRGEGPIFIHAENCKAFGGEPAVPEQLRSRLLSLRAYDGHQMMSASEVIEGRDLEVTVDRLFADETVAFIHAHNARPGCFAARIDRA